MGEARVVRGDAFGFPRYLRAAFRNYNPPEYRRADLGFRCAGRAPHDQGGGPSGRALQAGGNPGPNDRYPRVCSYRLYAKELKSMVRDRPSGWRDT